MRIHLTAASGACDSRGLVARGGRWCATLHGNESDTGGRVKVGELIRFRTEDGWRPALGGMLLGQGIRSRLPPEVFRRWFFVGLLVLGTYMVIRALSSAYA
jgi:hypothetical protein